MREELEKVVDEAGKWDDALVKKVKKFLTKQHKESVSKLFVLGEGEE